MQSLIIFYLYSPKLMPFNWMFWKDVLKKCMSYLLGFLLLKTWNRVSLDESLWKDLLHREINDRPGHLAEGKVSWQEEVKRVRYHIPTILTETLTEHTDEVLHVSFSHNGKLFSTTSKDATLKVNLNFYCTCTHPTPTIWSLIRILISIERFSDSLTHLQLSS